MIKIDHTEVVGWEPAIRGMRNPKNSWPRSDSKFFDLHYDFETNEALYVPNLNIGPNDHGLMMNLRNAGTDHRKCLRMIAVYADITAPILWWYEYDTYKVGTVKNSTSRMHKIHVKPFTYSDFTHEGIEAVSDEIPEVKSTFLRQIDMLEFLRRKFNETQDKKYWRALIEMLPDSYNMRATVMLNYEVLANQYHSRLHHKLDEWREYCKWVESLPYSELITGEKKG